MLEFEDAAGVRQTVKATDAHPFWDVGQGKFVPARELTLDMRVTGPHGEIQILRNTHREDFPNGVAVYNLTVDEYHTYYVQGEKQATPILVHNVLECGPGGATPNAGKQPNVNKPKSCKAGGDPTDVAVIDPARSRPKLRKGTKEQAQAAAQRTPDGDYIDPNTGEVIPIDGPFDYGHPPGEEWWRLRDMARTEGWTRQQVIEAENAKSFQIEDPSSNRGHEYEKPK